MTARILAIMLAASICAGALGAEESARQILDRRKALDDTTRHWSDRHEKLTLRISGRGSERVRELELYDRRESGDEQKTILFFLAPAEVKGTAFLAYTHKGRPADQWLYLPELQRVRQITARTRSEIPPLVRRPLLTSRTVLPPRAISMTRSGVRRVMPRVVTCCGVVRASINTLASAAVFAAESQPSTS